MESAPPIKNALQVIREYRPEIEHRGYIKGDVIHNFKESKYCWMIDYVDLTSYLRNFTEDEDSTFIVCIREKGLISRTVKIPLTTEEICMTKSCWKLHMENLNESLKKEKEDKKLLSELIKKYPEEFKNLFNKIFKEKS